MIALDADDGDRPACFPLLTDNLCSSTIARSGAETSVLDRTLHLEGSGRYKVFATAVQARARRSTPCWTTAPASR